MARATPACQPYRDIANGRAEVEEFNVLCRVCNALHYVKGILGVGGHEVTWKAGLVVKA